MISHVCEVVSQWIRTWVVEQAAIIVARNQVASPPPGPQPPAANCKDRQDCFRARSQSDAKRVHQHA